MPVSDLERAVAWYVAALGCQRTWSDENHVLLRLAMQQVDLLLVRTTDERRLGFRSSATGVHHGVIDFRVEDLEGFHAHLRSLGCEVDALAPPANEWSPRGFGFLDPDGNRFGAFAY